MDPEFILMLAAAGGLMCAAAKIWEALVKRKEQKKSRRMYQGAANIQRRTT